MTIIQKLGYNEPADLTQADADLFGTKSKADAISKFMVKYYIQEEPVELKNKMMVLFGEWGSGKTTVVNYLKEELKGKGYVTIYFPAWEYEKDSNIAFSLLDVISKEIENKVNYKELLVKITKSGYSLLKGFAKSITFSISSPLIPVEVSVDTEKIVNEIENHQQKEKEEEKAQKSLYHTNKEEFKRDFINLENAILENGANKIVVFVDDLDRCDPDNVLDLIAAMKHFFCLGKNTLFFFTIDKNAIAQAIKCRYGNYIEPTDYLEKVFDISFNMPQPSLQSMIKKFFENYDETCQNEVHDFLRNINYENPRNVKKLLNKHRILLDMLKTYEKGRLEESFTTAANNIYNHIFLFFMIIIKEHHEKEEQNMLDIQGKIRNYSTYLVKYSLSSGKKYRLNSDQIRELFNEPGSYDKMIFSNKEHPFPALFAFLPYLKEETVVEEAIGAKIQTHNEITKALTGISSNMNENIFMKFSSYLYSNIKSPIRSRTISDYNIRMDDHIKIYMDLM